MIANQAHELMHRRVYPAYVHALENLGIPLSTCLKEKWTRIPSPLAHANAFREKESRSEERLSDALSAKSDAFQAAELHLHCGEVTVANSLKETLELRRTVRIVCSNAFPVGVGRCITDEV
jgi:hypothetical protein